MDAANAIAERGTTHVATKLPGNLGIVRKFDDVATLTSKTKRSGREVFMRWVKNGHSTVLLPGTICAYKTLLSGHTVVPTAAVAASRSDGVVDWTIPTAGVPVGDGFWMIVGGPCKFLNDNGGALAEFDRVIASAAVAGMVKIAHATTVSYDLVGWVEEAVAAAAGATLAQGVLGWGVFAPPLHNFH